MIFYGIAFWLPAFVSAVALLIAWSSGLLRRPVLALAVYLVAFVLEARAAIFSPAWAIGLVVQVGLAVYLLVKIKLET